MPLRQVYTLLVLALLAWLPASGQQSLRLTTLDGLASNSVRVVHQDRAGYLWFGTADGLSRYDGHHFVNFTPDAAPIPGLVSASVGVIVEDTVRSLLWVGTTKNQMACYDLRRGCFADYLGALPAQAQLPEVCIGRKATVFSGEYFGLRLVAFDADGLPHACDFTESSGQLHANRMRPVCEDRRGTFWLPTHCGLATLTPTGRLRYLQDEGVFRAVLAQGDSVYVVDDSNTLYTYDLDGRQLSRSAIPQMLGATEMVWFHFRWRGRWVLLGRERAMLFDPATGEWSAPVGWEVANGKVVTQTGDYIWVTSHDRELLLFCPDGEVRRLDLLPQAVLDMGLSARYSVAAIGPSTFYIATNGNGLFRYDARTGALRHLVATDAHPVLHSDYLLDACVDRSGTLWLANELVGATCLRPQQAEVETLLPAPEGHHDRSNQIATCQRLSDSTIAVSTRDGHLYTYDTRTRRLSHEGYVRNSVYGLLRDSRGRLWMGTRGSGVIVDGRAFDPTTQPACPSYNIYGMVEDRRGRVWMATLTDGLLCAATDEPHATLRFTAFHPGGATAKRVNALCLDAGERLWVATATGLYVADTRRESLSDADFRRISWDEHTTNMVALATDAQGRVWVGTKPGGAVRLSLQDDGTVDVEQTGLNNVMAIVPMPGGDAWIATDEGILRWNARTRTPERRQRAEDALSNACVMGVATSTPDGGCLVGTHYGLVRIHPTPHTGEAPSVRPRPRVTDIVVDDSSLVRAGHRPEEGQTVVLRHDENSLSIRFSTLDFAREAELIYVYWLEGRDHRWAHRTTDGEARYDDLPPGNYRFHVRLADTDEDASETCVLRLRIRPPWWLSWWAWTCYVALFALLASFIIYQMQARARLRSRLRMEQRLTRFKLDFFTQVSHELRTPLALIQSGVRRLQADQERPAERRTPQADADQLQVIGRGTRRLTKLVSQLLLFRRINEDKVRLHVAEADIVGIVRDVCTDFFRLAEHRELDLQFKPFSRQHTLTLDAELVETIVYNLVSNAVKYTPKGGRVHIRIPAPEDGQLRIGIFNSAPPLSAEQRGQLFRPYMHGYASASGMGIGLYVAHQLATLGHGTLTYAESDGGICFELTLPTDDSVFTAEERQPRPAASPADSPTDAVPAATTADEPTPTRLLPRSVNSQRVVIVEDDTDMAEQLRQQVGVYFRVETETDGAEALHRIMAAPPDLVLCDIKLPSLDGFALTRRLRAEAATANLPVILLTAWYDDAHHIRGIESGANAFLAKPCNPEVLVRLIAQLIEHSQPPATPAAEPTAPTPPPQPAQREQVQQMVQQLVATPTAEGIIVTSLADQRFRERAEQLVAQNIATTGFTADTLAEQMGVGRTLFFRRFKQLMGHSPSEYIKAERMRLAARLILEGELNVAQVAQRTGFSDASHFIRVFKSFHGVTPSQFRQV